VQIHPNFCGETGGRIQLVKSEGRAPVQEGLVERFRSLETERKRGMRGTGGPLLCIGDLLCDVGEEEAVEGKGLNETPKSIPSPSSSSSSVSTTLFDLSQPPDLPQLFQLREFHPIHLLLQENYDQLNKVFDDNDHSWTALTLKMCSALDTATKLVESTNSNSRFLLEKIVELEHVLEKGDATREAAMAIQTIYSSQIAQDSISSLNEC
uniref:Uncharacterized protein n=1 Tax=Cucumis melo TaxID=3656 RepID=A0A9I9D0P6_CUCME